MHKAIGVLLILAAGLLARLADAHDPPLTSVSSNRAG